MSRAVGASRGEPRPSPGRPRPLRAARARARLRARRVPRGRGGAPGPSPAPDILRRTDCSGQHGIRKRRRGWRAVGPLRADHANLRAAFASAVDDGDQESATRVALGLRPIWIAGNLRQESCELVERLLDRFDIPGDQELGLLQIVAALEDPAEKWQRRFAQRAAELGDQEALGVATTQAVRRGDQCARPGRDAPPAPGTAVADRRGGKPPSPGLGPLLALGRGLHR